ncbi:MAG: ABC transporter permease [Lachnospiraceae bacterium]|nr:ABC transporter permease [Lachnospiraceae bacterium]MBO4461692.1 ABC transporter permease [Lachnospiraceae bacterium]MBR5788665.1 ABC transporter permease [Lachnospiraceae bacterium]
MFKAAWTIAKKEFHHFFGDKRLFFSVVVLPGLIMYLMYTFMGQFFTSAFTSDEKYVPVFYCVDAPESAKAIFDNMDCTVTYMDADTDIEPYVTMISDKALDLLIVYSPNFDEEVAAYDATSGVKAPQIEVYYNSSNTESSTYYNVVSELYAGYEATMTNKFDLNGDVSKQYDQATDEDMFASVMGGLIPMLLIMMMTSSCMSLTGDAIAGEKERGTIATLLATPVSRTSIAIGKILSISLMALMSAAVTCTALMASLPKLVAGMGDVNIANMLGVTDYIVLFAVVITTQLMIVSIFSVISAIAKTIKEAGGYSTPIYIVSMLVAMYAGYIGARKNLYMFTIPIYNSAMILTEMFGSGYEIAQVGLTCATNVLIAVICVYILTRLFNSEKVMFSK